jgi:hypothetical protein
MGTGQGSKQANGTTQDKQEEEFLGFAVFMMAGVG